MRSNFSSLLASLTALLLVTATALAAESAPATVTVEAEPLYAIFCLAEHDNLVGNLVVPPQMLKRALLQQELALTERQRSNIDELIGKVEEFITRYQSSNFKGVTYDVIEREAGEAHKRVLDILKPPQAERLKNLMFQSYGVVIVAPQDMQRMFRLSPDQEYQIDVIRSEMFAGINATLSRPLTGSGGPVCRMTTIDSAELRALVESAEREIKTVLAAGGLPDPTAPPSAK